VSDSGRRVLGALPEPVLRTLHDFESAFQASLQLIVPPAEPGAASEVIYSSERSGAGLETCARGSVVAPEGPVLEVQVACPGDSAESVALVLAPTLERAFEAAREVQFFTYELSERFEEINLLYSISETLAETLDLDAAAMKILGEVRDVMGARRGELWVHDSEADHLQLRAEVGDQLEDGPMATRDPDMVTAMVFRDEQAIITERKSDAGVDSFLSVPIRYTPPAGEARTVGVINLVGRTDGGRFHAPNQKLLAAIASQIGAALENHRLVQESLSKERMAHEMELAHDLQMKLLPELERFGGAEAAGRVQPTEQVGGDFYQLFQLEDGKVGIMLGDVSLHGFPSALIMTLTMSAAAIYARESRSPAQVLRQLDDALSDELETTEMFLTVFYGVLDPARGRLVYSNAGHPHAFAIRDDGTPERLLATDPPVGFAGPDSYHELSVDWDSARDLLLLFTDGLSDMLGSSNRGDGETVLLESASRHRYRKASEIVEALFALSPDEDNDAPILGDDRTALVVRAPSP